MKKTRVRSKKMIELEGETLRFCSHCGRYRQLKHFGRRADRSKLGSLTATYQAYCRNCMASKQAESRARKKESQG